METAGEIISAMLAVAPAGQAQLDRRTLRELRMWTEALLGAREETAREYERFFQTKDRGMSVDPGRAEAWLRGRTVLVTGGTGCIGSSLIRQISGLSPRRVVSLSRGVSRCWPRQHGVEYRHADVRDRRYLKAMFDEIRPEIVFHLAAQHDPGLAEWEVRQTVTTNVFGTRNVMAAAMAADVLLVVHASTGKAMRPYSSEVYAATKLIAEWVASLATASHTSVAAARFTHVVDNSIICERLRNAHGHGLVRLHRPDIAFYVQSALESAQLLITAGMESAPGALRVHAIRDIGWPVDLLDLALGTMQSLGAVVPIYFSGYDKGYGDTVWPGLYDPARAGEVSPLLNIFEAAHSVQSSPETDMFDMAVGVMPDLAEELQELERACSTGEAELIRKALGSMSRDMLTAALAAAPPHAVARSAKLAARYEENVSPDHDLFLRMVRQQASQLP